MRGRVVFYLLLFSLIVCGAYVLLATTINVWIVTCLLSLCVFLTILLFVVIIRPIRAVENGMDLLRAQDYASRLCTVGQKDTDKVVHLFNELMDRLKAERLRHEEQNLFLQQLIDASTQGIVIMDFNGKPTLLNPAAKAILEEIEIPVLKERETRTIRSNTGMIYKVQHLSFMDRGHRHTFYLIESLTEEVRQAEREAYGRVIRTIAHEVNNTMAGINSVMQLIGTSTTEPDIVETIESCTERSDKMSKFISAYASLIKIPEPQWQSTDLASSFESMHQFLMTSCSLANIELQWYCKGTRNVKIDSVLWEQAIINIVKNSIESIASSGRSDGKIEIRTTQNGEVYIIDNGAGLTDETAPQIFTPFFTTKPEGQGIGLMFVSEVLRRHGCRFSLSTDQSTGLTTFKISLKPY